MENKRSHKRTQLGCFLNVFDVNTRKNLGQILDITVAGFLLMNQSPISTHSSYRVRIDLPEIINGMNILELEVKSIWSGTDTGMNNTGFHIEKISLEQIEIIKNLIKKYCVNNNVTSI